MGKPSEYFQRVMASGEPQLREVGTGPWTEEHPGEPLPQDAKYDPELLETGDRRNVLDKYRYWKVQAIKDDLDLSGRNLNRAHCQRVCRSEGAHGRSS